MGVAAALSGVEHERLRRMGSRLLKACPEPTSTPEPARTACASAATRVQGRCSLDGGPDAPAVLMTLTPEGFSVCGLPDAAKGRRVVAEFGRLGNMSGTVERIDGGMAHVANDYSEAKRAKVSEMVAWLAAQDPAALVDGRRHARAVPRHPEATVYVGPAEHPTPRSVGVKDVSQSGAALRADFRVEKGATLTFGTTHPIRAKVVRHLDDGFAVEFLRILPVHRLDPDDGF